jgi:hypothetical protein
MGAIKSAAVLAIFLIAILSASMIVYATPTSPTQQNSVNSLKTLQFKIPKLTSNTAAKTVTSSYTQQPVDAVIILPSKNLGKTKEAVNLIKKNGGVVSIVYVPNTIIVLKLPKNIESRLTSLYNAKIYKSNSNLAELKKSSPLAANLLAKTDIKFTESTTPFKDKALVAPQMPKPFSPPGSSGYPPPSDPYITSYYMMGDVFVSIILPESNGTIDPNKENWTATEETAVDTQIATTLNWWVNRSVEYNVSYPLTFWVGTNSSSGYAHYKVGTGYEASQTTSADEEPWIQDMMNGVGAAPDSDYFSRLFEYDNAVRTNNSADWAFTLFVIDHNDYGGVSWPHAYLGGPFAVINGPPDNMAANAAHEMGHVFMALDEYSGGYGCYTPSDCTWTSGILNVENQNCQQSGCTMNVNSLMRSATMSAGITNWTAGQIGWRDSNINVVTDSIDYSYNPADLDTDGDKIINYWDLDDDNDGVTDVNDACPKSPGFIAYNGCSPPSISVNANASTIYTGEKIKISADATDNFKVTSAKLFLNGTDTSWSCSGLGTPAASCYKELSYGTAGSHIFYATATDDNNITRDPASGEKSFTVIVAPDITPPTVTVSNSPLNPKLGDTVTITASATDNVGLDKIDVYLDGSLAKTCNIGGALSGNCIYTSSTLALGSHTYYAMAYDTASPANTARDPSSGEKSLTIIAMPSQVSGLSDTISAFKNVNLIWNAATPGTYPIANYNIYRNSVKIGLTPALTYTDSATAEGTAYSYQISAVDTKGNEGLKSAVKSLYTGPLMIMSVTPPLYAVNVPTTTTVTVIFNIPVDKTKAQTAFHMYTQPAGPYITGSFSWPNDKTMIFTPAAPLDPAVIFYSCEERGAPDGSRGVQTADGLKLATKDYGVNVEIWNYIWSFTNRTKWP